MARQRNPLLDSPAAAWAAFAVPLRFRWPPGNNIRDLPELIDLLGSAPGVWAQKRILEQP
eukprot:8587689-Pyramimonas_sp.AAC.1